MNVSPKFLSHEQRQLLEWAAKAKVDADALEEKIERTQKAWPVVAVVGGAAALLVAVFLMRRDAGHPILVRIDFWVAVYVALLWLRAVDYVANVRCIEPWILDLEHRRRNASHFERDFLKTLERPAFGAAKENGKKDRDHG